MAEPDAASWPEPPGRAGKDQAGQEGHRQGNVRPVRNNGAGRSLDRGRLRRLDLPDNARHGVGAVQGVIVSPGGLSRRLE
jgi:hypothetical protein